MTAEVSRTGTELLARAWPNGVPSSELALLRSLPPDRAAKTLRRLAAVLSAEAGRNIGDLAADAGMDRHHFFRLRSRWRSMRSLRSIAPFAGRKQRRSGSNALDVLAAELLSSSDAERSAGSLADALIDASGGELGRTLALRTIRRARMRESTRPSNLARLFGRAMLVDLSAIDMPIGHGPGPGRYALAAFVVERSTGLILGHAAGHDHEAVGLQREALSRAWDGLAPFGLTSSERSSTEFVAADGDDEWRASLRRCAASPNVRVVDSGSRRFGERLVSIVGQRVGRVVLRPRASADTVVRRSGPHFSRDDVRALLWEAVSDFNAGRLRQLAGDLELDLTGGAPDPARAFVSYANLLNGTDVGVRMLARTLDHLVTRLSVV